MIPNDYQAGLRNQLPMINLLNPDGSYNENAGKYAGLDRLVVRKRVVEDLKSQDLLERVDSYLVRLNHSDRSKTPIEPYLSDQWFVRMGDLPDGVAGLRPAGDGRRHHRPDQDPPRALCQELSRLAGREARLVHQPTALVGASDPDLACRHLHRARPEAGLRRPERRDLDAGRSRRLAGLRRNGPAGGRARVWSHADAGPRRARYLVQLGALAPLDPRLAGGDPGARRSTIRPASSRRHATSSRSGSRAWSSSACSTAAKCLSATCTSTR